MCGAEFFWQINF